MLPVLREIALVIVVGLVPLLILFLRVVGNPS